MKGSDTPWLRLPFVAVAFTTLLPGSIRAADLAKPSTEQRNWPTTVDISVGDISTQIDGSKMWTLSGLMFRNAAMATKNSAYGTVLTIRGVGHLGTAHFLDIPNSPGEVEKELVTNLKFFVDEKLVKEFSPAMHFHGTSFRMERASQIRMVNLKSSISIRDGTLIETAHLHTTADVDLQTAFPLMYAWTPNATDYLFGNEQGVLERGTFLTGGKGASKLIPGSRWVAIFNAMNGMGSVALITRSPPDAESAFFLVDAPGSYRKTALHSFGETIMPKGFDGVYQVAVGFFSSSENEWEHCALNRLDELKNIPVEAQ